MTRIWNGSGTQRAMPDATDRARLVEWQWLGEILRIEDGGLADSDGCPPRIVLQCLVCLGTDTCTVEWDALWGRSSRAALRHVNSRCGRQLNSQSATPLRDVLREWRLGRENAVLVLRRRKGVNAEVGFPPLVLRSRVTDRRICGSFSLRVGAFCALICSRLTPLSGTGRRVVCPSKTALLLCCPVGDGELGGVFCRFLDMLA